MNLQKKKKKKAKNKWQHNFHVLYFLKFVSPIEHRKNSKSQHKSEKHVNSVVTFIQSHLDDILCNTVKKYFKPNRDLNSKRDGRKWSVGANDCQDCLAGRLTGFANSQKRKLLAEYGQHVNAQFASCGM